MHKLFVIFSLAFALVLMTQADGILDLEVLKAKFLPAEFVGMNFTAAEGRKLLKEKCEKVAGNNETVFLQAHRGALEFVKCISNFGNLTAIQEEIEIAKPIGELDTIFQKYCNKKSHIEMCFDNLLKKINPCLSAEEKARHSTIYQVASKMAGFMCHKGGDQIALFYAEQGPECLEENKDNINYCMNASFADYIPKNGVPDVNNLPQLAMGKKECQDMQDFEKCVLFHLEKCNDITPSNIIESVFKFVKNETQCEPKPKVASFTLRTSGAESVRSVTITLGLVLFVLKLVI
ncbi:27 kDa hemolymph protein-like [Episyrphus balteatus]|uniref:27 kDa hemolymph protein-like n=1 Tax=Episyrphus balteatus TaxID=286459 RepID=UPI0024869C54|nr:27 kDa hemolymph protein-like [Episyrphus balteatus]